MLPRTRKRRALERVCHGILYKHVCLGHPVYKEQGESSSEDRGFFQNKKNTGNYQDVSIYKKIQNTGNYQDVRIVYSLFNEGRFGNNKSQFLIFSINTCAEKSVLRCRLEYVLHASSPLCGLILHHS